MNFFEFRYRERDFSPDKFYHLYNQGFVKMKIFKSDKDCYRFTDTMLFYGKVFGVKFYNYTLMANHFHFLVGGGNIGEFMKRLGISYATYFNIKYDRRGQVFNGRFNSIAVTKEEYFKELEKYIAMNPVKLMKTMPFGTEVNSSVQIGVGERSKNVL